MSQEKLTLWRSRKRVFQPICKCGIGVMPCTWGQPTVVVAGASPLLLSSIVIAGCRSSKLGLHDWHIASIKSHPT
eukprot:10735438-Prorocentrum_lima.AAC.1